MALHWAILSEAKCELILCVSVEVRILHPESAGAAQIGKRDITLYPDNPTLSSPQVSPGLHCLLTAKDIIKTRDRCRQVKGI